MGTYTLSRLHEYYRRFDDAIPRAGDLYQGTLTVLAELIDCQCASLFVVEDKPKRMGVKANLGSVPGCLVSLSLGESPALWCLRARHGALWPGQADVPASLARAFAREGVTALLLVPLMYVDRTQGVLELARLGEAPPMTQDDLSVAMLLGDRLAASLYTQQLMTQLETHDRFVANILEGVPSSLVIINRNQQIVSANANFLRKAKRQKKNTIGRRLGDVFPQTLMAYTHIEQKVQEVFGTSQTVDGGKLAFQAPGLPTRIYYYRLFPLKVQNRVENVALLMDDITDQEVLVQEARRVERHLASVVGSANDLVVSLTPQGEVLTWNPAAESISHLRAEQVKGRGLSALCTEQERPAMLEMLQAVLHGVPVRSAEVRLVTTDGRQVPIAWSCSAMRDDLGEIVGIVAIGRDLTERRQLESQLVQSAKMASLGVMAGGIAHEVRNPLGIISAGAQLMLEHPQDVDLHAECAQRINAAVGRASAIIENLLKFSRPQTGQVHSVDLNGVLHGVLALLAHELALQKVVVETDLQAALPAVWGNPYLLQQVFANLIFNARNAMPEGGTLTISTRSVEDRHVEVAVQDTGCGIAPENLARIFDPFFTTMPAGKGTGLGLSISYSIVQQHRGSIEVRSKRGVGSTFIVRLPTEQAKAA